MSLNKMSIVQTVVPTCVKKAWRNLSPLQTFNQASQAIAVTVDNCALFCQMHDYPPLY
jgi:hypothetical protein